MHNNHPVLFFTTQSDLVRHNGKVCRVIVPLDESEYDKFDVGPMYRIVLEDGTQLDCYKDELYTYWEEPHVE